MRFADQELIVATLVTFPQQFGLRGFPGDTFRCSETDSYVDSESVVIYTERLCEDGIWRAFAKGSVAELRKEFCSGCGHITGLGKRRGSR